VISEQQEPLQARNRRPNDFSRRRFLERAIALGIGSSAALTLLDACGSIASASGGHTPLVYWNLLGGGDGVRMVAMENMFSKANPAIQLQAVTLAWGAPYYTKLAMSAAGGRPPDVAISHITRVAAFAQEGLFEPFDLNELAQYGITADKFLPLTWQRGHYNGKLYAIPLDTHPIVSYYNVDICKKAGLLDANGVLKPMDSPEAVIDALQQVKRVTGNWGVVFETNGVTVWRLFYTFYSQLGGKVLTPDGKTLILDDNKAVQALTFLSDLFTKSKVAAPTIDYAGSVALFGSGKSAFFWEGEWEVTTFEGIKMNFNMVPFPNVFGQYFVQADSHSFVLPHQASVDPDRRAAALLFISSILKNSLTWAEGGHIPAYQPVVESTPYKQLKPQSNYASSASNAIIDPIAWFSGSGSQLESEATSAMQPTLNGQFTPQQGVDKFRAALQKLLSIPPPL